jgi:hypothetical protein
MPIENDLDLTTAQQILKQFDYDRPSPGELDRVSIQTALSCAAQHSEYQILGICADSLAQGVAALNSYATALGYAIAPDSLTPIDGSVYIKFNPKSGLLYADSYTGEHRGVLVSCQSSYDGGLNDMFGHLPLTLFDQP